ncbi:hypothetical protein H0H92_004696 [Tricholoma furcatifolium]|nr:hypothetical protein H0H92_004696 [Tricholoma furcatifolium]
MNVSSYLADISHQFTQVPLSSYLAVLWNYYIQYLWHYQPNSWVARIAYICRVLAILISLPIIILGLLDISSYGIARTLGVIDDVKASTSDSSTVHGTIDAPSIRASSSSESPTPSPYTDFEHESTNASDPSRQKRGSPLHYLGASQPLAFYASDEGDNLKLSGVGVFSPAASRPPSPVLTRKAGEGVKISGKDEGGMRQRVGREDVDAANV